MSGGFSKIAGLDVGLVLFKYFLNTEYLHLGYWPDGLEVKIQNLPVAQEHYANLIVQHLPPGTGSILEVGCGSGRFALKLADLGYRVECVSPESYLTDYASKVLGDRCRLYRCRFEDFAGSGPYDLVLFSESFQYIRVETALEKALELMAPGGHLLICDFFKTGNPVKLPVGGGHRLDAFVAATANLPLEKVTDLDITRETAPNLHIINDLAMNLARPFWEMIQYYLEHNRHPRLSALLKWKYRRRIERLNRMFREPLPRDFGEFQSYRLFLYRKLAGVAERDG